MEKFLPLLEKMALFKGISPEELTNMLVCLRAKTKKYKNGQTILLAGDKPEEIGILLSGKLQIVRDDAQGSRTLLAALSPTELFAEALCCAGVKESPVTVIADGVCEVMLLPYSRILQPCGNACAHHSKIIENMLGLIARKNLYLQNRVELIRTRSIRVKVLSYLGTLARVQGKRITVPFSREEMADYLCVERSALSHELMKMKSEGLIDYRKNNFELL